MLRQITVFCVTILIIGSVVTVFGQLDSNLGNTQPGAAAPDTGDPNSNLLQSDLSSAALAPCVVIGRAGNWSPIYVDVTVDPPVIKNSPGTASVNWSPSTTTCVPTTCTWTISSVPPGPAQIYLVVNGANTDPINVDSLTGVVNRSDNVNWFTGFPTNFTAVGLAASGQWFSKSSPKTEGGYPVLEWAPNSVTLVYQ
jgi:hypothetical protein